MARSNQQSDAPLAPDVSLPLNPPTIGAGATPGPVGLIAFEKHVDPLAFLGDLVERYGDVVRYQTRMGPCILFVHPEHVQTILHSENYRRASLVKMMLGEGLLASDGPRWRSQRRLMQRDFLPVGVAPFISVMARETAGEASAWQAAARAGEAVDVTMAMTRLTLRIVVAALFSDDLSDEHAAALCAAVTQTVNDLGKISWTVFGVPVLFTPDRNASFASAKGAIDGACHDMIARRKALAPADRPRDLLTMLIEAQTDSGPLDDRQLRDEIVTMLVGGHETTALALAWAWKAMAEHPEIEATLYKELDGVLGDRTPGLADLPKLVWTRAIVQEAMRLYPPVWYMARVANKDDVIHGHAVPRGTCVLISAWLTHRHKDFWPDAERFDPARFAEPAVQPPHRYAYFPFGGGRHQCLGMHFALMEATVILAELARQFRVRPVNGQHIKPDPGITLRQSPGMLARVESRAAQPVPTPSAPGAF
ncbi:MAG: cytochrome [Phycisphaerales bacterium]|jgi:cytochrome P450|nr:cytochrome [Phycisphaerales bacterium]